MAIFSLRRRRIAPLITRGINSLKLAEVDVYVNVRRVEMANSEMVDDLLLIRHSPLTIRAYCTSTVSRIEG
jgi:hypothetical protein